MSGGLLSDRELRSASHVGARCVMDIPCVYGLIGHE
jgi:hypothetical protein